MTVQCIWEHNGNDTLLYADTFMGAFTRGSSLDEAIGKMAPEIRRWCCWAGWPVPVDVECVIVQERGSTLMIRDADSDVLFDSERKPLTVTEYAQWKALALKSAHDFQLLYESIPEHHQSCLKPRKTFYDQVPGTAQEMYDHTRNVNDYYFGEIGIAADHEGDILSCRERGFAILEQQPDFLNGTVYEGSYGEQWSLRKVIRRFLWHDRIHARAMWRMATKTFPDSTIANPFGFQA